MHPREITRAVVIIPAQMQATMHGIQDQLPEPVAAVYPSLAPRHVLANDNLSVDQPARATISQIKRQHVRRAGLPQPLPMQSRHNRCTDHSDFQPARGNPLGAHHKPHSAHQGASNLQHRHIDLYGQARCSSAIG